MAIIVTLIISLLIIILYLSISAKAGLIRSTDELEEKNKALDFAKAFNQGQKFFWRLLGMVLLVSLTLLITLAVVAAPLIGLYVLSKGSSAIIIAVVLAAILFLILFIVLAIYLGILLKLAERVLVLKNYGILKSLQTAHQIIRLDLGNVILTWLIGLALSLLVGVVLFLGLFTVGIVLFGMGAIVFFLADIAGAVVYGIIVGSAFMAALLVATGLTTAFISSYWTLSYRALDYLSTEKSVFLTKRLN